MPSKPLQQIRVQLRFLVLLHSARIQLRQYLRPVLPQTFHQLQSVLKTAKFLLICVLFRSQFLLKLIISVIFLSTDSDDGVESAHPTAPELLRLSRLLPYQRQVDLVTRVLRKTGMPVFPPMPRSALCRVSLGC